MPGDSISESQLVAGGIMFVICAGAFAILVITGNIRTPYFSVNRENHPLPYWLLMAIDAGFAMLGVWIFITGLSNAR